MWENENAGMENARNGKCGTKTAGGGVENVGKVTHV